MAGDRTTLDIRWRCGDGVALLSGSDDSIHLTVNDRAPIRVAMRSALARHLTRLNDGMSDAEVAAAAGHDYTAIAVLFRFASQLRDRGLLLADLYGGDTRLATVRPLEAGLALPEPVAGPPEERCWRLARFALLRRERRRWVLESTEASCDVVIHDPALLLWLHAAAEPAPEADHVRRQVLHLLAGLAFLERAEGGEAAPSRMWEFHDRLLHCRSRNIGGLRPCGATYRFLGRTEEGDAAGLSTPSALRESYPGDDIDLPVPEKRASLPLVEIMDRRRSTRSMGDPPVSLAEVAALFYRVARVTKRGPGDYIQRPYPSGGSLHELEFYLAVRACRGLQAGFYHYRGDAHVLTRLAGDAAGQAAASMIDDCARAWRQPSEPPQCLAVISSRLPRLAWKYEAVAYRVSLLGAGVALQSLCLAATDLGLNGCIAGSGDSKLFVQATGMSSWEETSIAEFGFGSRPVEA